MGPVRNRRRIAVGIAGIALIGLQAQGVSLGASPHHGAKIVEQTTKGYLMTVTVSGSGHSVKFKLNCPGGKSLGTDKASVHRNGHFSAELGSGRNTVFRFTGHFDSSTHFQGTGSVKKGACGAGAPTKVFEPKPGEARMTSCPTNDTTNPLPANTVASFAGVVPGAALNTKLRLEYTDPSGATIVVHLRTDAAGAFQDTHAFPPSSGGYAYGADAIPRYPDAGLSPGKGCSFVVQ